MTTLTLPNEYYENKLFINNDELLLIQPSHNHFDAYIVKQDAFTYQLISKKPFILQKIPNDFITINEENYEALLFLTKL